MSRRSSYWDNAHRNHFLALKNETSLNEQETYEKLQQEIDDYMYYIIIITVMNGILKKMTPVKYRNHLESV